MDRQQHIDKLKKEIARLEKVFELTKSSKDAIQLGLCIRDLKKVDSEYQCISQENKSD